MGGRESDCIRDCLNGHPEAYGDLVRAYQAALLSALAGRLGAREDAEDAAQETFVRAFFRLRRLRSPRAFFPWLLGIARRVAQGQRRKYRDVDGLPENASAEPADRGPAPSCTVDQGFDLEQAIAALPKQYQAVVLLRYYGGRSCAELAELLGVPVGTVTKRLSRAHALLREALRERL